MKKLCNTDWKNLWEYFHNLNRIRPIKIDYEYSEDHIKIPGIGHWVNKRTTLVDSEKNYAEAMDKICKLFD